MTEDEVQEDIEQLEDLPDVMYEEDVTLIGQDQEIEELEERVSMLERKIKLMKMQQLKKAGALDLIDEAMDALSYLRNQIDKDW